MADERVTIAVPTRPEVRLRTGGVSPSVVARPIPVSTPGIGVTSSNTAQQLVQALDLQTFSQIGRQVLKESRETNFAEGQLAQAKNQEDWAAAVASGKVDQFANPWFIKGYQNQDGRVAGLAYYTEMAKAYAESPAKGSDDSKTYEEFVSGFTKQYLEKVGAGKSADWIDGFKGQMESAQRTLASEHREQVKASITATQEANTGAEINVILNSTSDPKAAADAINALGQKMKLQGMPSASFEKVAAEAVLAKAKLGNGRMLATLDHVTTGDGKGTLASNPKVTMAKVDVSNFLTEKARGDTRWAWALQDREYTLQQRKLAEEAHKREGERWERQKAEWDRQEKSRSLMTRIITSTITDPQNSYANNREMLKELAELNPTAAESSSSFIDGFLTRREKVPDSVERPVLAQLHRDMITSAGDPAKQQQLLLDANRLFVEGKLSREGMTRFIDDAQRFSSWDPGTYRKLQDPQVERVRQTAKAVFMDGKSQSLYGSAALDALVTEQVIDKAVIEVLKVKPQATGEELAAAATKALQATLPTLNPNVLGLGRATDLQGKVGEASRNIQQRQPQDGNTPPPPPRQAPDTAAQAIDPVDAQVFIRTLEEAYQTGGLPAMTKAIADYDAAMGIPGLGQKLIDLHAKPRTSAPAPKK